MYGQIAEAIVDNENLSYLCGDHLEEGPATVKKWAECLDRSSPEPAKRRSCIEHAFKMHKKTDLLRDEYKRAMVALCKSDADTEHLLGLARPHARPPSPPAPPAAAAAAAGRRLRGRSAEPGREVDMQMLSVAVDAYDRLGRAAAANRLIARHARASPRACVLLVKRLADCRLQAGRGQRGGGGARPVFGADPGIARAAASVYSEGDPPARRRAVLADLFVRTADRSYYERLRRLPGWGRARTSFIRTVARDARLRKLFLLDILVREGMHKRAIEEIAASGDIGLFERYRAKVSAAQPRAYLAAYGRQVKALGARASTGAQYARVAQHLKNMSKVRSGGRAASRRIAAALAKKSPGNRRLAKSLAPFPALVVRVPPPRLRGAP